MKKVSVVLATTKTTIILPFFLSRLRGKRKERSGEISKEKMVVLVEDISVGAYRLIIESPPFACGLRAAASVIRREIIV